MITTTVTREETVNATETETDESMTLEELETLLHELLQANAPLISGTTSALRTAIDLACQLDAIYEGITSSVGVPADQAGDFRAAISNHVRRQRFAINAGRAVEPNDDRTLTLLQHACSWAASKARDRFNEGAA